MSEEEEEEWGGWVGGGRVRSKSRVPVSIDRRYASVDRIDNSIKCPHITLLIAPLSRDASRRWAPVQAFNPLVQRFASSSLVSPRRTRLCTRL